MAIRDKRVLCRYHKGGGWLIDHTVAEAAMVAFAGREPISDRKKPFKTKVYKWRQFPDDDSGESYDASRQNRRGVGIMHQISARLARIKAAGRVSAFSPCVNTLIDRRGQTA